MIKRNKVDLASLYPTPKTYDEIESERVARKERNKPRHVPAKIGAYWTTSVATVIATYYLCDFIVRDSLVSALGVIIGICMTLLVMILSLMVLKHIYSRLRDLIYGLRTSAALHIVVFVVLFAAIMVGLWLSGGNLVVLLTSLVLCFVFSSLFVSWSEKSNI